MGVQVPVINRMAPQATPSVGRLQVDTPNFPKAQEAQTNAVNGLLDTSLKAYDKAETDAADTISTKAANDYHQYLENALEGPEGAKRYKGDPTEVYNQYDTNAKRKFEEIVQNAEGYSERAKAAIQEKLNSVDAKFYDRKVSAYGNQLANYNTQITNDGVGIAKNDMLDATAHLDLSDKDTTIGLDRAISQIEDLRIKNGLKNGSVKEILDPETGQLKGYDMNPSVKLDIAKDISDGLTKTIENLIASGDVDGAKYLSEKYATRIDSKNAKTVSEKTTKAFTKQEAQQVFQSVENLPVAAAMSRLDKIKNPEVQEIAYKLYDDRTRRKQNLEERGSKANYNDLAGYVMNRQRSNNPFQSEIGLEGDPQVKRMLDKITNPKQRQAIYNMVTQPKDSNPRDKAEAHQALFDGKFEGMSPEDFNEIVVGLNKKDRATMETQWRNLNTATSGEKKQMVKYMGTELKKQLQKNGVIKKDMYGKYSNEDDIKITEANDELIAMLDKLPANASLKDQNEYVKKLAADKIKEQVFSPPVFEKKTTKTTTPKGPKMSKTDYIRDYRSKNGDVFPTSTQINAYLNGDN